MCDEQLSELGSDEIEVEAIGIEINSQPIELYKIFKIANLVNGGGEAKHIISEGYVAVNGEIETRKRRKIYDGDLIEFNQEYYVVLCDLPEGEMLEKGGQSEACKTKAVEPRIATGSKSSDKMTTPITNTVNKQKKKKEGKPMKGRKPIQLFS